LPSGEICLPPSENLEQLYRGVVEAVEVGTSKIIVGLCAGGLRHLWSRSIEVRNDVAINNGITQPDSLAVGKEVQ
jgi:hypothetical protein